MNIKKGAKGTKGAINFYNPNIKSKSNNLVGCYEKMKKKEIVEFDIRQLLPIGMTIVVFGIGIAFGLQVTGDIRDDMTAGSAEENATNLTITAVSKFPEKLGIIVTAIIAAILIGILVRYLMVSYR